MTQMSSEQAAHSEARPVEQRAIECSREEPTKGAPAVELEIEYRAGMRRWRVQAACHTWVAWFDEQPMAVDYAYGWARKAGGGVVRIQSTSGRWRRVQVPRLLRSATPSLASLPA